jgi:hypothetical protein
MGFATPNAYLLQLIAATLAGNEADTYINDFEVLASGCEINRP